MIHQFSCVNLDCFIVYSIDFLLLLVVMSRILLNVNFIEHAHAHCSDKTLLLIMYYIYISMTDIEC